MVHFVFHHKARLLPTYNDHCHPVLMYDKCKWNKSISSSIARPVIGSIRDLGCRISNDAFDFITIAMAVTAADTFYQRENSLNSWARDFTLEIPLYNPDKWVLVSLQLEKALNFLTGDQWNLKFVRGGLAAPIPKKSKKARSKRKNLIGLNCVSLFSGGLDSAVGAIDLINGENVYKPLLVSHAYKGDATKQQEVKKILTGDQYSSLSFNADPHIILALNKKTDISMRGRSFNFIAMAVAGLTALQKLNRNNVHKIFIPENGYISLNPPLTRRRIGSLSTRTTHPHFLDMIQTILDDIGFDAILSNPYQCKTKGEMLKECQDQIALEKVVPSTVSCSNWHRKGIQCGRCVPCIIRRAAIFSAGFSKDSKYESEKLVKVLKEFKLRDDLLALASANIKLKQGISLSSWLRQSGPLPHEQQLRNELIDVFSRGLKEVGKYLNNESVQ